MMPIECSANHLQVLRLVLFTAGLACTGPVHASLQLAQKEGCLGCHTLDKRMVGPSFREVATRYQGDAGAEVRLIKKVREGGKGTWGQIIQPPNTNTSDENLKKLVRFVLSQ